MKLFPRLLLMLLAIAPLSACAASPTALVEGEDYELIAEPGPFAPLAGKIEVAGNSALDGTILLASHPELAASVAALRERITVVELAAEPGFQDAFADAMLFPEFEVA